MKRVLKLLIVLVLLGAVSSCIKPISCGRGYYIVEAKEEYDMIASLEKHSPWLYDDGNVSLSVSFKNTSEHKNGDWKRDELSVDIKVKYSNKTMKYSFKSDTYAWGHPKSDGGTVKGHDIRSDQAAMGYGYADIHIHYNNDKDITFEFLNATLENDPVTTKLLPKPIPFVEPLRHLKPID